MRNIKFFSVILGLLLSFVTRGQDNSITNEHGTLNMAGQTYIARINTERAVVYSDENMLSPIGYIASGKAITVGNPRRMNRELVPLIIYGKLAFIEIKDISYEDNINAEYNPRQGVPREHNFDLIIQRPEEQLAKNNSAYFSLHTYSAGEQVKKAFLSIQGSEESSFTGFQAQLIHRKEDSSFFWGAAFDYSGISKDNMSFKYWMIAPTFGYTPIKNPLFSLDLYASLDLAVTTEFDISNNYTNEPAGFVWGPQVNARVVLFPTSKYHLLGGVGLRNYTVQNLETLKDENENDVEGITRITGASLFIGFGMEFR